MTNNVTKGYDIENRSILLLSLEFVDLEPDMQGDKYAKRINTIINI